MIYEKARLEYLAAMGVTSWVPRQQLPGAKPSIRLVPQGKAPNKERALEGANGLAAMREAVGHSTSASPSRSSQGNMVAARDAAKEMLASLKSSVAASANGAEKSGSASPSNAAAEDKSGANAAKSASKAKNVTPRDGDSGVNAQHAAEADGNATPMLPSLSVLQVGSVMLVVEQPVDNNIKGLQYPHRVLLNDAMVILAGSFNRGDVNEQEIDTQAIKRTAPRASDSELNTRIHETLQAFIEAREPTLLVSFGASIGESLSAAQTARYRFHAAPAFNELFASANARLTLANQLLELSMGGEKDSAASEAAS
ncbi:hypothetical protein [Umboniibacter marinipuniceus]|uniref:Uncharacterized protein n=1 Tax=Umboniibacter marinipuniceus TaxID=569599 RepID=A0A3M0AKC3_9GAMM|nr:hypothetical protein [Umboniibacter marinipuniceus]RMA79522.1 hypothetical protein DFR27_1963 [Umboniibacter marinipuniceus]